MRNLCKVYTSSDLSAWKVLSPLWLAVGPIKLLEADVIRLVEAGWGDEPVHPSIATCNRIAVSLLAHLSPSRRLSTSARPGAPLHGARASSMAAWSTAAAQESPAHPPAEMLPAPRNVCVF